MTSPAAKAFFGWRMVFIATLCQNCCLGIVYGSFGPMLGSMEQHFGVSRAVASTGMSLFSLAFNLSAPIAGNLVERVSLRKMFLAGALVSTIGYVGLALAPSIGVTIAMFGFIGLGCTLLGAVPPITLVSRWFSKDRAKALAIVMLPIFLFATPFAVAEFLPLYGRSVLYGAFGVVFVLLIPFTLFVIDRPDKVGQQPWGHDATIRKAPDEESLAPASALSTKEILSNPSFWLLCLTVAFMMDSGTIFVVHIVPFGVARQMSLQDASGLLSIFSASGVLGNLLFGWIADRKGPLLALLINATTQAILWWTVLQVSGPSLYFVAAMMGLCCVPMVMLNGAALAAIFGVANIGKAVGFNYAFRLPFLVVAAPVVGYIFDRTGGYDIPFIALSLLLLLSGLLVCLLMLRLRRGRQNLAAARMETDKA